MPQHPPFFRALCQLPMIDTTAMVNIRSLAESLQRSAIKLYLMAPQANVRQKLARFGLASGASNIVIVDDPVDVE